MIGEGGNRRPAAGGPRRIEGVKALCSWRGVEEEPGRVGRGLELIWYGLLLDSAADGGPYR
jgi:hypothetical protein